MDTTTLPPSMRALVEFRREVAAMPRDEMDAVAIERRVQELTNAVGCDVMRGVFERADSKSPEVLINGEPWGNRRMARGTYMTVFGEVEVERATYQKSGRGRVAVPMELRLRIAEGGYTPRTARILTQATALMTSEEAERFLEEAGVAAVSVATLHRVPRAMAARHEQQRIQIEEAVREQDPIPPEAVTVQVLLDGVMVPQDGEHAQARGRKTDVPTPPRHEVRYGAPVDLSTPAANDGMTGRAWHEASVGALAFFDADGHRLKTIYMARMPEPGKCTLQAMLTAEFQSVMVERPELNVCFASDGAAHHWTFLEGLRDQLPENHTGETFLLADFFHVAEYVQKAADVVAGKDTSEAKVLGSTWRETIKELDDGPMRALKAMRYQRGKLTSAAQREEMQAAINYIARQTTFGRTKYAEALRRGYPIGSGIIEAAAKTVVSVRMKRAGARYSQHGGQTIMLFRAAVLSNRFDILSRELEATYGADVREAA